MGNIQCEFDERAPSGLWKAYEKEDGTLLTGSYYPRPSTKPLDCDLTKSGFIRLRFRVKGVPAGEDDHFRLADFSFNFRKLICRAFGEACKAQLNDLFH